MTESARTHVTAVALDAESADALEMGAQRDREAPAVVLVGDGGSALSEALRGAGLATVAVRGEDAVIATRLAVRQLDELRALRARGEARATTERAKGLLMARHGMNERDAFELLRSHARRTNQKLADVAAAVLSSHLLLPARRSDVAR
ncbi:MAG: ANTAR domain-containing response regulator [Gaiellaceae bacterium]